MKYSEFRYRWEQSFLYGRLLFYYQLVFLGWYSVRGNIGLINDLDISNTSRVFGVLLIVGWLTRFVVTCRRADSFQSLLTALIHLVKNIPCDVILTAVYLGYFVYPTYYKNTNIYVYLAPLLGTLCLIIVRRVRIKARSSDRVLQFLRDVRARIITKKL